MRDRPFSAKVNIGNALLLQEDKDNISINMSKINDYNASNIYESKLAIN